MKRSINVQLCGVAFLVLAATVACRSETPSNPAQPSTSAVNVGGTWRGTATDSSGPGQITMEITQSGTALSGTVTMTVTGTAITGRGTMTGTVSVSSIQLSIAIPAGGFDAPFAACTAMISGNGQASTSSITATYTGTNSCTGRITGGQLTLNK